MENEHRQLVVPPDVPTPTRSYRERRKTLKLTVEPGAPVMHRIPVTPLAIAGARVLLWKQDPSVAEIGIRKAYLPLPVSTGPKDARIQITGLTPVTPNAFGDLIQTPGTDAFDAVHTFAVVRQTLTLYQRALAGLPVPWQWNSPTNTDPLSVFPHAGVTQNAYYSRNEKALKFFYFDAGSPTHTVFTCRSFDIVAHETGHAILDGLKPKWIEASHPQTGGLHESFGDLTAIFLALSQLDQVEAVIAQTKANLHDKTFIADLAEEFGLALGRPNGLRNADNDLKLSDVTNEVHAISQVFTGAIYDILADIFQFERRPAQRDDAAVLLESGAYVRSLLLRSLLASPDQNATFVDVANRMLAIAAADGKPVAYRNFIRNRFVVREVMKSPVALDVDHEASQALVAIEHMASRMPADRSTCCGTMNLAEFNGQKNHELQELAELRTVFGKLPQAAE